ncbi:hypothetical protein QQX98_000394 [Neonectria punicea]|uniref:Uncharacterized protein n=1 Tax=Neonectria punicea TaxID=979145 RepID=A0ABR1HUD0_9HYPO
MVAQRMQIVEDEDRKDNMEGKVFLITGCSSGIGIDTARAAAATGAKVFRAVRSLERGQVACGSFLEPGRVELLQLDTSSLASVRTAADEFLRKSRVLNVLICNAGVMAIPEREESVDGFEMQLATNYLGHFLFFWLLKDAMLASSTPEFHSHLVNVSSAGQHASEVQFEDLNLTQPGAYEPWKSYGQSKLAQIYMSNSVERKYGARGLHSLSLMPGGISTNLQKHIPEQVLKDWAKNEGIAKFMESPAQGAATTMYAAISREWEGKGGKYLENCRVGTDEPLIPLTIGVKGYAYDKTKEEKLWQRALQMLDLEQGAYIKSNPINIAYST